MPEPEIDAELARAATAQWRRIKRSLGDHVHELPVEHLALTWAHEGDAISVIFWHPATRERWSVVEGDAVRWRALDDDADQLEVTRWRDGEELYRMTEAT